MQTAFGPNAPARNFAAMAVFMNFMNKPTWLTIGIITLPLLSATAQWGQTNPLINVSGSAEVKVAPDEVDLSVSVETRDASLDIAKRQNDDSVAKALDFLKHNGVKEKDIQTDYITVEPEYDSNDRSYLAQIKPLYFRVSKGIGVKLTNVSSFDNVLTGLIANGVNNVEGVDFRTTDLRKYKDQARASAIRAAREKADAMAAELGVKVGKPFSINVQDTGGWTSWSPNGWGNGGGHFRAGLMQNSIQNAGGCSGENGPTFAVGQISVSATVNVAFLIQ